MTDLEKEILQAAQQGVAKAIHDSLNGYHSPLQKLVNRVVDENEEKLLDVMRTGFSTVISTDEFKNSVMDAFQHKIAKLMVTKLEGTEYI